MRRLGESGLGWGMLAVIAAVCALLSSLPYRRTGVLSTAHPGLVRASLNDQLRRLSQEFNRDIRENCMSLTPGIKEVADAGTISAVRSRYEQWVSSHERDLFLRIGVAVAERGSLALHQIGSSGE